MNRLVTTCAVSMCFIKSAFEANDPLQILQTSISAAAVDSGSCAGVEVTGKQGRGFRSSLEELGICSGSGSDEFMLISTSWVSAGVELVIEFRRGGLLSLDEEVLLAGLASDEFSVLISTWRSKAGVSILEIALARAVLWAELLLGSLCGFRIGVEVNPRRDVGLGNDLNGRRAPIGL